MVSLSPHKDPPTPPPADCKSRHSIPRKPEPRDAMTHRQEATHWESPGWAEGGFPQGPARQGRSHPPSQLQFILSLPPTSTSGSKTLRNCAWAPFVNLHLHASISISFSLSTSIPLVHWMVGLFPVLQLRPRSPVALLKTHFTKEVHETLLLAILQDICMAVREIQALVGKNMPANAGDKRDTSSILGLGRSPGGGHGNPLQYSCLENPMDRGAWRATVHGVAKSWTWLKWASQACMIIQSKHVGQFKTTFP